MPGGRPSPYRSEFCDTVKKLAVYGATDSLLADFFEVTVSTIQKWKIDHPEFSDAIKVSKDQYDDQVEHALFERARGYSHEEDDIRVCDGEIVITPTIKHYPPDPTAAIFWLKNRRKDKWREKHEIEVTNFEPVILMDENGNKVLTLGMQEKGKCADDKNA